MLSSQVLAIGALLAPALIVHAATVPLNDTASSYSILNATASSSVLPVTRNSSLAATTTLSATPVSTASRTGGVVVTTTIVSVYTSFAPEPTAFSPPVYPAPETRGEGSWAEAVGKARARLSSWTLEQKVNLTTGVGWYNGRCVGNIAAQPEVSFGGICLDDSPVGVRFSDFVSSFPAGINAAATFDRDLIRARGLAMGKEFRGKGVHVALSPMMNMGRVAAGGRNWEGFGADPYLTGEAAYETIMGLQTKGQGVQACMKHYIGNEEERNRTEASSNINDRTLHEIYLHPFLRSVQADVTSAMCAYNLVNNSWACQNSFLMNGVLKHELGFQGFIMSDWAATESGVGSALAGLDMTMPGDVTFSSGTSYFGANLTMAVNNGSVPASRVDDMATRILAGYYMLEQDDPTYPAVNFDFRNVNNPATNSHVDVQDDHYKLIRTMGAASTVLLKNVNGTLPLVAPRSIAVIGNGAGPSSLGPNGYPDRAGSDGVLAIGWGSGTANFPYLISPLEAIQAKARENRTSVSWVLNNNATASINSTAAFQDVALVFINSNSGEEYLTFDENVGDRNNLTAWQAGDALVRTVAANNKNTVVVYNSVGPSILESWIDHPNVTAVLWAGLPGQEAGNSIVDVLWGAYNPSARLPYTIAKAREDYPAEIFYENSNVTAHRQIDYTEELEIDYRHFQAKNIEPRFGFGFGLSYTTFEYSNLGIYPVRNTKRHLDEQDAYRRDNSHAAGSSVSAALHAQKYSIEFDLTNTGSVNGCDVPQLYLKFPASAGEPPRVLRGFSRINLDPGATKHVKLPLSLYDLSIWDVVTQRWIRPEGEFGIIIGQSAFDTQLNGTISA